MIKDLIVTSSTIIKTLKVSHQTYYNMKRDDENEMILIKKGVILESTHKNSVIFGMVSNGDVLHQPKLKRKDELIRKGQIATMLMNESFLNELIKPDVEKKKKNPSS